MANQFTSHVMKPWMEVAPALLKFPLKCSNPPKLETIVEERAEEYEDDDDDDDTTMTMKTAMIITDLVFSFFVRLVSSFFYKNGDLFQVLDGK